MAEQVLHAAEVLCVGHGAPSAGFHFHSNCAGTLCLESALLISGLSASTQSVALTRHAFSRLSAHQIRESRETGGLAGGLDPEHRYQSGIDDVNVFFLTGT